MISGIPLISGLDFRSMFVLSFGSVELGKGAQPWQGHNNYWVAVKELKLNRAPLKG